MLSNVTDFFQILDKIKYFCQQLATYLFILLYISIKIAHITIQHNSSLEIPLSVKAEYAFS